jgi:hypothetical protein
MTSSCSVAKAQSKHPSQAGSNPKRSALCTESVLRNRVALRLRPVKRHPYFKLNMSRYAVSVSRNGAIEWSNPSRAFQRLREQIDEEGRFTENAKQKALTHSSEWVERAENCEKKEMQTDNFGNMQVILDHQDCLTMAEIWRQLGLNMTRELSMREINRMVTPIPQTGASYILSPGSPGTYENMEKLEGNYDLLEDWEDKTDFVDAQDESTWPIFLRRNSAGTPLDVYRNCGHCVSVNIVIDEHRGEAYCNDCGMVLSDPNSTPPSDGGYDIELKEIWGIAVKEEEELEPDETIHLIIKRDNEPPREITVSGTWVSVEYQHPLTGKTQETRIFFQKKSGGNNGQVSNPAHRVWLAKQNRWRRTNIVLDPLRVEDDGRKLTPVYAEPFHRRR